MRKPPCADWKIWVGAECEGKEQGTSTVFIRALPETLTPTSDLTILTHGGKYRRVWFCKEMRHWPLVEAVSACFDEVVIEVDAHTIGGVPRRFLNKWQVYYKLPLQLKRGDYVCVGPAFHDEAFKLGTGVKANFDDYLKDVKIL